jgi:hypothetical protein
MEDEVELDNYVYPGKRFTKSGYTAGTGQGMSLRDHFAGQAMIGWMSAADHDDHLDPKFVAALSYEFADAMLEARKALTDKE